MNKLRKEVSSLSDVHVQTLIDKEKHRSLRIEALDTGISLQKLLRMIITKHLNKKEGGNDNG